MTLGRAFLRYAAVFAAAISMYSCTAAVQAPPAVKLPQPPALKARAIITAMDDAGRPISAKATIIAKKPGYIRVEVHGPFGQTAALLISDNDKIYAYSGSGAPLLGLAGPDGSYPLTPDEVYSMLTGSYPAEPAQGFKASTGLDKTGRIAEYSKTFGDYTSFTAAFSDYREVAGYEMPFSILLRTGGREYAIKYSSVEANPEMPPDAFTIPR